MKPTVWFACIVLMTSFAAAVAQVPSAPPLGMVVQKFLDRFPPYVYIDLSCSGDKAQQRSLINAGVLNEVDVPSNCVDNGKPAYTLTANGSSLAKRYAWRLDQQTLVIPVGAYEARSEQQCGNNVQYRYRIALSPGGQYLTAIAPARAWRINGSLPHGLTLGDAGNSIDEVLHLEYVRDIGWTLDFPKSLGWPGTSPPCPTTSSSRALNLLL